MTIALNFTDQEAEKIIEACKALKGNPVLWLLSDRLQSVLDMERDNQAEAYRLAAENSAREAWRAHLTKDHCPACTRTLAAYKNRETVMAEMCADGLTIYQTLLAVTS